LGYSKPRHGGFIGAASASLFPAPAAPHRGAAASAAANPAGPGAYPPRPSFFRRMEFKAFAKLSGEALATARTKYTNN
jgi:hypothetical protein